jgi:hypothetical protein
MVVPMVLATAALLRWERTLVGAVPPTRPVSVVLLIAAPPVRARRGSRRPPCRR